MGVKMDSSDDEQISVKPRKKVATIDSDASEDETEKPSPVSEKSSPLKINESSDEEDTISKSKKKGAALDSDSDSDNEALKIDSSPVKQDEISSSPKKLKKKKAAFDDSDNSEDEENVNNESVSQKLLKNKDLYDAEDSSDDDNEEPKKKLQDRKTKEAAMKEIYSESQRMFRQSGIQVGYHRPKQRTLEEFLNRKKKQVIDQVIGDDLKIRKVSVNTDEYERKLEECEKATEEFYKNDE